jgi:hypothetical protein
MCKYSYGNGRCGNIDIEDRFCIGEKSCSVSNILRSKTSREEPENGMWQAVPSKIWNIGKRYLDK